MGDVDLNMVTVPLYKGSELSLAQPGCTAGIGHVYQIGYDFDFCDYHVEITTAFAYPDECLTDASNTARNDYVSVCAAQGMRASNLFSGYAHGLCNQNWMDVVYVVPTLTSNYRNSGTLIAAVCIVSVL